jgi:hypothetical protein
MYYKNLAFATASNKLSAECLEQVKAFITLAEPTAAQKTCETTCGTEACWCESGMPCTPEHAEPTPTPSHHDGGSDCEAGLSCVEKEAGKFVCNSSTIASAAVALAAVVLAVVF